MHERLNEAIRAGTLEKLQGKNILNGAIFFFVCLFVCSFKYRKDRNVKSR